MSETATAPPGSEARPAGALRGLLVDWGGVMTSPVFASLHRICEAEGVEPTKLSELFRDSEQARELLFAVEQGRIGEKYFERRLAGFLDLPNGSGLIRRIFEGVALDGQMIAAVRSAHAEGIATGVISNSWGTNRYPRELFAEIFDGVVISAEFGIRKPNPRIYLLGARAIARDPRECVFVDDFPVNLDAARVLGMQVVHHVDAEQTIAELERLLGLRLRAEVSPRS